MSDGQAEEAVERLLERKARLLAFLDERLGNRADAEDLLQAAMEKVVSKRRSLRRADKLVPWFYRLLRNLVVDWYRRQAVQGKILSRLAASEPTRIESADVLFSEACRCVHGVMATLKREYEDILRRVELDGRPLARAARDLGITRNSATVRLHRARRALLEGLRATCGACLEHGCLDCDCRKAPQVRGAPGLRGRGRAL